MAEHRPVTWRELVADTGLFALGAFCAWQALGGHGLTWLIGALLFMALASLDAVRAARRHDLAQRFWRSACAPLVAELWSMRHPVRWARRTARNFW